MDISVNAARSSFCLGLELSGSEQDRQHIIRQGSFLRNFLVVVAMITLSKGVENRTGGRKFKGVRQLGRQNLAGGT